MLPERLKKILLLRKLPALVTSIGAIVAFVLALIALLSSGDNGLRQNFVVSLNTSTLFQDAIKIQTNPSVTARDAAPFVTSAPEIDPRALFPEPSAVASFFGSIGSQVSSAISPIATGLTGGSTGLGQAPPSLQSFVDQLFGTLVGAAGTPIINSVNAIIAQLVQALGIRDWYGVYLRQLCSGDFASNSTAVQGAECTVFNNISIPQTPSTVQLGTATVDFSALNFPAKLARAGSTIQGILTAIFAFQIIGIATTGLLILVSPLMLFFSIFQSTWIRLAAAGLAVVASISLGFVAAVESAVAIAAVAVVNTLGDGLGIVASSGGGELAILWVSFFFIFFSATSWIAHLVTKWHEETYVRREEDQKPSKPLNAKPETVEQMRIV